MIKYIPLIILVTLVTSCSHSLLSQGQDGIIVYAIRKENNFHLATKGLLNQAKADAYNKDESKLCENYLTRKYRFTSIESARTFFCNLFEEYIKPFNRDSQLKSSFKNFPLTANNVQIEVRFADEHGLALTEPAIAKVKNMDGMLYYYGYNSQTKEYVELFSEPYESALQKI